MQTFGMDFLNLKSIENVWTLLKNQMHAMRATSLSKSDQKSRQDYARSFFTCCEENMLKLQVFYQVNLILVFIKKNHCSQKKLLY